MVGAPRTTVRRDARRSAYRRHERCRPVAPGPAQRSVWALRGSRYAQSSITAAPACLMLSSLPRLLRGEPTVVATSDDQSRHVDL